MKLWTERLIKLGFMTALSTTPESITYEVVYLPQNHFIREESMTTEQYLSCFFPFDELDFVKRGVESSWSVSEPAMAVLVMTMSDRPQAVTMSFQRGYAEPYEWLLKEFTDWAFTFLFGFLYYQDMDKLLKTPSVRRTAIILELKVSDTFQGMEKEC